MKGIYLFVIRVVFLGAVNGVLYLWTVVLESICTELPIVYVFLALVWSVGIIINFKIGKMLLDDVVVWDEVRKREKHMVALGSGVLIEKIGEVVNVYDKWEVQNNQILR